jgi:D-alanyl-D-alanine dipeptidase
MNIQELIARSHESFEEDPKKLPCIDIKERLAIVHGNSRLLLEPIWRDPIVHDEGFLYKDYIAKHPKYQNIYLRREVATRLYEAAENLPVQYQLVLRAGHRPLSVQAQELEYLVQKGIREQGMNTREALVYARTFVDDPTIKIPSHCSGSAVDVELFDKQNNSFVDFGSFMNTESKVSYLHAKDITKVQKDNRTILLTAMLRAGFAPTYVEWWHYSYGDTVWAYFYNKKESLYGAIEPDL